MKTRVPLTLLVFLFVQCLLWTAAPASLTDEVPGVRRLLYVASPGIRNYLEYGGHGLLVFDIEREPPPADRSDVNGILLPPPQFATDVTKDQVAIVEFDDHLEFGRAVTIQLDAPVKGGVSKFIL